MVRSQLHKSMSYKKRCKINNEINQIIFKFIPKRRFSNNECNNGFYLQETMAEFISNCPIVKKETDIKQVFN